MVVGGKSPAAPLLIVFLRSFLIFEWVTLIFEIFVFDGITFNFNAFNYIELQSLTESSLIFDRFTFDH